MQPCKASVCNALWLIVFIQTVLQRLQHNTTTTVTLVGADHCLGLSGSAFGGGECVRSVNAPLANSPVTISLPESKRCCGYHVIDALSTRSGAVVTVNHHQGDVSFERQSDVKFYGKHADNFNFDWVYWLDWPSYHNSCQRCVSM